MRDTENDFTIVFINFINILFGIIISTKKSSMKPISLLNEAFARFQIPFQKHEIRCNIMITEAVVQRCSVKKVFLEILQNSQENTCARVSFLIMLQA